MLGAPPPILTPAEDEERAPGLLLRVGLQIGGCRQSLMEAAEGMLTEISPLTFKGSCPGRELLLLLLLYSHSFDRSLPPLPMPTALVGGVGSALPMA